MKKIDGKEYYTFTGLIERMKSCKNRQWSFGLKDIPEKVEFKNGVYYLNEKKTAYFDRYGTSLTEMADLMYGNNLIKYSTEFDFIVTPKETIKVTISELNLIRYMNMFGERSGKYVSIESGDLGGGFRALYLWDNDGVTNSVDVNDKTFTNLKSGVKYNLRDLEVSNE